MILIISFYSRITFIIYIYNFKKLSLLLVIIAHRIKTLLLPLLKSRKRASYLHICTCRY